VTAGFLKHYFKLCWI